MRERSWRGPLAIAGLLGLLAVVAIAAAGRGPGRGVSEPSGNASHLIANYLATLAIFMVPAGVAMFIWALVVRRSYQQKARKREGSRSWLTGAAFLVVVLIVSTQALRLDWLHQGENNTKDSAPAVSKGETPKPKPRSYQPQFQWLPVVVVGGLIIGISFTVGMLALRRRRRLAPEQTVAETLSEVLAETLDDLRTERDPRKAVIRAYARMERMLAARGVPRHESEAPVEYLVRVLEIVQASAHSIRRLTRLFERARFSPHRIDDGMKEDAIEALSGLRAELEVAH